MEILHLEVEPLSRNVLGQTSGLQGNVKVSVGDRSIEFPLSYASLQTLQECVERDFDVSMSAMFERKVG